MNLERWRRMNKIDAFENVKKVTYLTPASTIVLVSSVDKDGNRNLAPFAMFMVASSDPPMITVAINPKSDTYHNIIETGEFVVGIPTEKIVNELYQTGNKYPHDTDEFTKTGLTGYDSKQITAQRIAECSVNLECKLEWYHETGNHTVFCGKVVDGDLEANLYFDGIDNIELRKNISKLYHISGNAFMTNQSIIYAEKE